MIKKSFLPIILVIFLFSMISCQKDNPVDSDTDFTQYLPLLIGNSWKYDVFETDTSGKRVANIDSYTVRVLDTLTYNGKKAIKIDDDGSIQYMAIEGSKLFMWGSFDEDEPDKWLLVADLKGSKWTLLDKEVETEYEDMPVIGQVKITCSKGKKENKIVKGNTVESQEFIIEFSLEGQGYISESMKVPVKFKNIIRMWYGKNIGRVLQVIEPNQMTISGITIKSEGEEHELIDYTLK